MPTRLQDLPLELIQDIFTFVGVADAENLLQLEPLRQRDPQVLEKKIKAFRHLEINSTVGSPGPGNTFATVHPFESLSDAGDHDPDVLRYVESLDLRVRQPLHRHLYTNPAAERLAPEQSTLLLALLPRLSRVRIDVQPHGPIDIEKVASGTDHQEPRRGFRYHAHAITPELVSALVKGFPALQQAVFEHCQPDEVDGDDIRQARCEWRLTPQSMNNLIHRLAGLNFVTAGHADVLSGQFSLHWLLSRYLTMILHMQQGRDHAGDRPIRLEKLRVGCRNVTNHYNFLREFKPSLSRMSSLRILDVTFEALRPPTKSAMHLIYYLPLEIEVLKIQGIPDRPSAQRLFHGMKKDGRSVFPRLKRLVISSPSPDAIRYVQGISRGFDARVDVVGMDDDWTPF